MCLVIWKLRNAISKSIYKYTHIDPQLIINVRFIDNHR